MGEVRPLLMNKTNGRTRTQGCDSIVERKDKSAYTQNLILFNLN